MAGNVLTWKDALIKGCQPGLYSYRTEDIPIGEYNATLDFKIWAKKVMGISCYFTIGSNGNKIQLTVYCSEAGVYKVGDVEFISCPIDHLYRIKTVANQKEKIVFSSAAIIL